MQENLYLVVLSFAVVGATAWILIWFFRRLRAIEKARWGVNVHKRSLSQELEWTAALRRLIGAVLRRRKANVNPQTP